MTALGPTLRLGRPTIADRIEQLIGECALGAGDRLPPERTLAELLGISRPSLREALKKLEAVGRVRARHGTGVWIQPPNVISRLVASRDIGLQELFAMREVLEVPAAGWAAEAATRPGLDQLAQLLAEMKSSFSVDAVREHDIQFHLTIAEMAGNRFLLQTMGVLHDMLREGMDTTLRIPGRLARAQVEHHRILDTLIARDAGAARHAMRTHIRGAQRAASARLAAQGSKR